MPAPTRVLFDASGQTAIAGIWITDGTAANTSLVKQGVIGYGFTQFGNRVMFSSNDTAHGTELWVTDGTAAGTYMLKDINPGAGDGFITHANGTSAPTSLRPAGTKMVFLGNDGSTGQELWVTDGTSAGTSLLKDIRAGSQPSNPTFFAPFEGKQLFAALDGVHLTANDGLAGQELWVTDGTVAGTSLLADLDPALQSSGSPRNLTDLGASGRAVFSAAIGNAARELWVTDGTAGGTSMLKNINTEPYQSSNPSQPALVGTTGRAVFAAVPNNSGGSELWVTDGTSAGTSMLKTFSQGFSSGSTSFLAYSANGTFATLGDEVLFTGSDGGKTALWGTDGTAVGTVKLSTDGVFVNPAGGTGFTPFGGKDLFWNGTGIAAAPWITDGTATGTFQLVATNNSDQGELYGFGVAGGKAVFNAVSNGKHVLWATDGTTAGTADLGISATNPKNFTTVGNKVVFQATDTAHGTELWVTDGTFAGTALLKDINTVNNFSFSPFGASNPINLTAVTLQCFAAGTRILADGGEIAVETLRVGNIVTTASGAGRPVRWIGHRHVDIARHPRPEEVRPVRIAPHAFGANQPHTPLILSPDHAIHVDGVLIPVKYLTNGDTVAPVAATEMTYYHVELDRHDVVLAEGLPVESYLDTGDRDSFAAGGTIIQLAAAFATSRHHAAWEGHGCAPLCVTGPTLDAVRMMLGQRAAFLRSTAFDGRCARSA